MLTGQNGILNKAAEAKTKTGAANEKEAVDMAALEALTEGNGIITKEILTNTLKSYLGKNDIELTGEGPWQLEGTEGAYAISKEGNVAKGWICIYDANGAPEKVTNGKLTLKIGDYINYNPGTEATYTSEVGINPTQTTSYTTNGPNWSGTTQDWTCYKAEDYQSLLEDSNNASIKDKGNGHSPQTFSASNTPSDVKWRVLGADEKTGELLIFATNKVGNLTLRGITGYLHGADEINNICNAYGQGEGATGGKSITLDEINKAIGRPNTKTNEKWNFSWTSESLTNKGPLASYGSTNKYLYFSHLIKNTNTGIFNYYDATTGKWVTNEQDLTQITANTPITTLTRDFSGYSSVETAQKNTKGYDVVFKANGEDVGEDSRYWLGASYRYVSSTGTHVGYAYWSMYYVHAGGDVSGNSMYSSFGQVSTQAYGVRPVVSLKCKC